MPTSSKVLFSLSELREKALEAIDSRIAQAQADILELEDDGPAKAAQETWRSRQVVRLHDLVSDLPNLSNEQLASFRLDPLPRDAGTYQLERAEKRLSNLRVEKAKITAKSGSLKGDEDGNIALTKTQLAEFFSL